MEKIPILGDLPVLGQLFRNRRKVRSRSEVTLLLSPRIVRRTETIDQPIFRGDVQPRMPENSPMPPADRGELRADTDEIIPGKSFHVEATLTHPIPNDDSRVHFRVSGDGRRRLLDRNVRVRKGQIRVEWEVPIGKDLKGKYITVEAICDGFENETIPAYHRAITLPINRDPHGGKRP